MNIPSFHLSEIVRIIGKRQTQATYDAVCIIPKTCKFQFDDQPISIPVPSTSTSTSASTKIVPLRRVVRKVTITGVIIDQDDGFSKTGVTLSDSTGAVSSGSVVSSIVKKKWLLEEMFNQGAAGEGISVQWRAVVTPSANPQTNPPTAPSDETKNMYHKLGKITSLSIDDDVKYAVSPQTSMGDRYIPEKMDVTIVIQWGSVQA